MSKMMLKMLADMAGITPDEIQANVTAFQKMAVDGIGMLESIDNRLANIERHLGIPPVIVDQIERLEHGQEN